MQNSSLKSSASLSILYIIIQSITRIGQKVYEYCYNFSQQTPFSKGINYGCKNYGISFPTANCMLIKQWIPNAKQVYLLGDFNQFNSNSHRLQLCQEDKDIYYLQLDITENKINNQSRVLLRIIDTDGNQHKIPPPSSKIRNQQYAFVCMDISLPQSKAYKKHDIIVAYTIDLGITPLQNALYFVQTHQSALSNFNTVILRRLFKGKSIINRNILDLASVKYLRDLISRLKFQMGLRIIIQWGFEPGTLAYGQNNPIQRELLRKIDNNLYLYDIQNEQVASLYLANLSYFLSTFHIDGFHFKHIDRFCKTQQGQVLIRCMNIMNSRLHQGGFTLASSRDQIAGLGYPILDGGVGFSFVYRGGMGTQVGGKTVDQIFERFSNIVKKANCIGIDFNQITKDNQLNFMLAVLISGKGIFCRGSVTGRQQLINKLFRTRRQPEIFCHNTVLTKPTANIIFANRKTTYVLCNFSFQQQSIQLNIGQRQVIWSSNGQEPIIGQQNQYTKNRKITLLPRYCCVFQDHQDKQFNAQ